MNQNLGPMTHGRLIAGDGQRYAAVGFQSKGFGANLVEVNNVIVSNLGRAALPGERCPEHQQNQARLASSLPL